MSTKPQVFALRHPIDRLKSQKQPLFTAFVNLKRAYIWQHAAPTALDKVVPGRLLAVQHSCIGGTMSRNVWGSLKQTPG